MKIHIEGSVGRPVPRGERLAPTPRLAFDASYDRVVRQLERCRECWQDSRRRPRTYYAPKHLR
jgi:hypothetical protein